jgi:hypothetical protein
MRQRGWGDVAIVQREEREMTGHGLVHLVGLQERERERLIEKRRRKSRFGQNLIEI